MTLGILILIFVIVALNFLAIRDKYRNWYYSNLASDVLLIIETAILIIGLIVITWRIKIL